MAVLSALDYFEDIGTAARIAKHEGLVQAAADYAENSGGLAHLNELPPDLAKEARRRFEVALAARTPPEKPLRFILPDGGVCSWSP